jgi:C4-dicarboxylate-specific signal transduction histidine kinase
MSTNRPASPPRETARLGRLMQPLSLAIVVTAVIFALWELAERTWFASLDLRILHRLHIVRGISSSLLVAALVGWMIVSASPRILHIPPAIGGRPRQPSADGAERIRTYARWFIAMRWIAVLLAAVLVFISVQVLHWLPPTVWRPLVLTVSALVACNIAYMLLLRWNRAVSALLLAQGYIDLVLLTLLLHFSGGIENPLSMMMIFHVIIGGILLSARQCYAMAAAASGLFAAMAAAEWSGLVDHYTLQLLPHHDHAGDLFHPAHNTLYAATWSVLQAAVLFLTAYFVTTLARRLRENEQQVVAMAERALADRQLLERSLETTGAGLRVLDGNLQPFWSNNRWAEWFICQAGEVCTGCGVLQRDDSPARQCLQDGRVRTTEIVLDHTNCPPRLLPASGGQRVFQVTTAPLLDAGDNVVQIVELAQDVTEQKQVQARILHAGKLAAVGELAGEVAHEVNNPISIISAKATLLLSDHAEGMSPKVAQELAKITELARRVARIAQGLLSYCRPSAAARARLDVRGPIRRSVAAVEEQARRGAVRIDENITSPLPLVKANPHELEQVFLNLFLNALDAMPKGGWLTISTPPDETVLADGRPAVAIMVADTGSGIPEEIRAKILEPFFTTKKQGRGAGLGLPICLGLVRSHGGELEFESKLWQGTRVTVKLPIDAPVVRESPRHG